MTPIPVFNQVLTAAELADIETFISGLETVLPAALQVNLTEDERRTISTVGPERFPLMVKTLEDFAPANPKLQPAFTTLADATNDYKLAQQIRPFLPRLKALVERFEETQQVALHETWQYVLDFYAMTQQARQRNVPGSEAVYAEMFPYFDQPERPDTP
jgi:hypothetical protein